MKKIVFILYLFLLTNFVSAQTKLNVFDVARKGTVAQAKELLKSNSKIFDEVSPERFSPLILACYRGNNEVAKFLIESGCDLNKISSMGTPLMAAIVKENNEIAKLLIEKNADLNLTDNNGINALIYAVQFQNKTILKLLIQNNVDKNHKDKEGKTAFEYAVFSGNEDIINLLK
jgi:ankyrin repeat protein